MKVTEVSSIAGALLFTPTPHVDERGFFCRTFDADIMRAAGVDPLSFIQDSVSRSAKGVVRGMHMRRPPGEAKLVRCSYGAVFDVIVDLRPDSATLPQLGELRAGWRRPGIAVHPRRVRARVPSSNRSR